MELPGCYIPVIGTSVSVIYTDFVMAVAIISRDVIRLKSDTVVYTSSCSVKADNN